MLRLKDVLAAKPRGYIPGLDGLRAISISLVMVAHFGFGSIVPGGLGVTVFFFVSGFLITTLLIKEREKGGTVSLPNFYARRFLRLSPELFLLVSVSSLAGWLYTEINSADILSAATYTTNYYVLYRETYSSASVRWTHLWSLAVEEHFYLTFPLMMLLFGGRMTTMARLLIGVCLATLLWRTWIVASGAPFGLGGSELPYTYLATDARIDSIAYGCLTAVLFRARGEAAGSVATGRLAILGAMALMVFSLLYRDPMFRETLRYSMQGLSLMLLFFGLFGPAGTALVRLLEMAPMRYMGVLSYGAYLWHIELTLIYKKVIGETIYDADVVTRLALLPIGFGLTFLMAQISFYLTAKLRGMRRHFHPKAVELAAN